MRCILVDASLRFEFEAGRNVAVLICLFVAAISGVCCRRFCRALLHELKESIYIKFCRRLIYVLSLFLFFFDILIYILSCCPAESDIYPFFLSFFVSYIHIFQRVVPIFFSKWRRAIFFLFFSIARVIWRHNFLFFFLKMATRQ